MWVGVISCAIRVENNCRIEAVNCSRLVNCRYLTCFHVKNECFQSYQSHLIICIYTYVYIGERDVLSHQLRC